ncbi:S41 family peptidase [Changchengzhania lutea]|uniref:S41 family peptidase n=1 Tax=Changchengzhania lutea TaxID=2049305 RepID=UPI00163D76B4|nr:S41 family peptidase [Changchengzhania lutea]
MAKSERIEIFEQVWNTVNEHFYDPNFNGIDWEKKHMDYKAQIEACNNTDSLFSLLNIMLFELNSSHCGVGLISELNKTVSPYIFSNGEIGIDIRVIKNQIVVTKVLKNFSADIANINVGFIIERIESLTLSEIEKLVKFKPPFNDINRTFHLTSEVLRLIYGQSGTRVELVFLDEHNKSHSEILTRTERQNGISLGGGLPLAFLHSESYFISKDIAYLSFNAFNPANLDHVLSNLEKVEKSKGLIIDLRGNDGGSIEAMKLLLGRFVSERRKYGTYINRNEQNEDFIEPIGSKYQGKVAILIDEMSISGAENMAGIIQYFKIGKIIGNQTPGQMLWGNGYLINDSIALVIPIYKFEYPNGFNPENNGITPDIAIEMKREDLLKDKDTQLLKAIEYLNNN